MQRFLMTVILMLMAATAVVFGSQVIRQGTGVNAAALQPIVDQFRVDLGGTNNGVGGSFQAGRREINWDGVPDTSAAPNFLPSNFFNSNSPRGVIFSSRTTFGNASSFLVSADSSNPTVTPVRFGNIDPSYATSFQTFSAERLFLARSQNSLVIEFFIPGTSIPATVSGFGAVFSDVDQAGPTYIKFYGVNGQQLAVQAAPTADNGLSFIGVSFNAGERISRVEIISGNTIPAAGSLDEVGGNDIVAMDDFIYGEPRAANFHANDFDGDGFGDASVFRPSTGQFFVLNSGSNTLSVTPFGTNGDLPVEGDFDGDMRADVAIYRPSVREWWVLRSSDGGNFARQFGAVGDRQVPADYDKDGMTDIALWRPSSGQYFILRSSDGFNSFFTQNWGTNGDIPVGATAGP